MTKVNYRYIDIIDIIYDNMGYFRCGDPDTYNVYSENMRPLEQRILQKQEVKRWSSRVFTCNSTYATICRHSTYVHQLTRSLPHVYEIINLK